MKCLEDSYPSQIMEFTTDPVDKDQIKVFVGEWDPQRLHLDEDHATALHGRLIASGFHTILLVFEPVMSELMTDVANLGGLGFDNLKWPRPLRPDEALNVWIKVTTLAGEDEFCKVFHDDARTPVENLVGEINKGWSMAKALLGFERIFIGAPILAQNALNPLEAFALGRAAFDDPGFCDRFGELALDVEDHEALYTRFADQLKRGGTRGTDVPMLKVWVTETCQKISESMIKAAGPDGATLALQVGNVSVDVLSSLYKARPTTIYCGSNEIQRNILSKTVLGL